jgi:hypothetical protein
LLALAFIDHGRSLLHEIAGQGSDPFAFIWFLQWWPWAISHHIDPLFTDLLWQPVGVYLDWVTSVPLLGLAGWPLTAISPVLTFNVFILLGPVLAAFAAYLLCLRIAGQPAAAMIGGFLFGYSSYEMAQDIATLNLSFTMFVPLLALIILLRLDNGIGRPAAILLAGLALICQFLLSIEICCMDVVFGGIAWALAMVFLPERRAVLLRLVVDGLLTGLLVLTVLSPILHAMAAHARSVNLPAAWPYYYATDLLNLFIPAGMNLFGGGLFRVISSHFMGGVQEQDGYLGLPLLVLIVLFIREQWGSPAARLLVVLFFVLTVLSLGPLLWVGGKCTSLSLPWTLFLHLPLVRSALPARFSMFVSLCSAIIAAVWIASPTAGLRGQRLALGGLACLALLPALHPWRPLPSSAFFQPGRVQAALGENARILVLPFSIQGPSSFWQAQSQFGFVQTGGYLGFPPKAMQAYPAVSELFGGAENPGFLADIANFCAATHTQFIVVGPGTPARLQADIARLRWREKKLDEVVVYTVPAAQKPSHDQARFDYHPVLQRGRHDLRPSGLALAGTGTNSGHRMGSDLHR